MGNRIGITGGAALLLAAAAAYGEITVYPDYPETIERDYAYDVKVVQDGASRPLTVYNHCERSILSERTHGGDVNRRFCEFAFSGGPARVDVRVAEDVACYKVFPARRGLRSAFKDGVISVWLDRPVYFGLQLNDSDKTILSVFADAPEDPAKVPAKGTKGVLYVDRWLDAPGADGLLETGDDVREIYIAPGAVLNARLKIRGAGTRVHGRGMVLDPMSDIFRFDQTRNTARGVIVNAAKGISIEDVKVVDARTFNFISWMPGTVYRNVKALASMMCSDGFTNGGSGLLAENCWLYVGDNALVVGGVKDAVYRDIVIGTSCAAIFPQGDNAGAFLENVDVFRADDGLINNTYNDVLRRGNKWNEMNGGTARAEKGPQDLRHRFHNLSFRNLSAVDCTLFSHFFRGRNMGTLPKTFTFDGCSIPSSAGRTHWQAVGKTGGVAIETRNNPARWLVTDNYALTFTNLWIAGRRAAFAPRELDNPANVKLAYATTDAKREVPLAADRHEVGWTCPWKVTVGGALQRDWRLVDVARGAQALAEKSVAANLVAETSPVKSVWQRQPSWMTKLEATGRANGAPVYRLVQCEKGAGMQAVVTDGFLRRGNGKWRFAFELKAQSETPFGLEAVLISNEKRLVRRIPVEPGADWTSGSVEFDTDFDLSVTDLVALFVRTTAPADEICFRALSFAKALPPIRAIDLADSAQRDAQPRKTETSYEAGVEPGLSPDGDWSYRFKVTKPWRGDLPQKVGIDLVPAFRDWTDYDRLVLDIFNDAPGGDVLTGFIGGKTNAADGVRIWRHALKDHDLVRTVVDLNWPTNANPRDVGCIHLRLNTPMAADIRVAGFHLLRPGEEPPPVSPRFLVEKVVPLRTAREAARKREREEARVRFVADCRAAGQKGTHAWIGKATSMVKVMPRAGVAAAAADRFALRLARGEYESLQVAVMPSAGDLEDVSVEIGDLVCGAAVLPGKLFKTSPVGYVRTVNPAPYRVAYDVPTNGADCVGGYCRRTVVPPLGWWPDPILDHLGSAAVRGDDLQSFWVRLKCPRDQPAGIYRGTLAVKGKGWRETFPLEVRVYGFEVPRASPLPLAITFDPCANTQFADSQQLELVKRLKADPQAPINCWRKHETEWGEFLAEHYITLDNLYRFQQPGVVGREIRWDILERLRAEGRLGVFNLGYWDYPRAMDEASKAAWREWIDKTIAVQYEQAKAHGLLDRAYLYGCDEVVEKFFPNISYAIGELKRRFPGVPLFTTAYDSKLGVGSVLKEMDWFCPLTPAYASYVKIIPQSRAAGHQVWWYICCGPNAPHANLFVEHQAIEARMLMGAQTAKYRPDGFLYYQLTIWNSDRPISGPDTFTDWNPVSWTNFHGDGSWFCVGPDGTPCGTVRMENFRDGLEDYAYVLEYERRTGRKAEIPVEVCRDLVHFNDDPAALYAWRDRLAEEIERAAK